MRLWIVAMTFMALVAAFALPAMAGEAPETEAPKAQEQTAATVQDSTGAAEGLMVFIDPATGKRTSRPTPEQRAEMQARIANALSQSDAGTYDEVLPNGAVLRDLQGRFQSAVVVRVNEDGKREVTCVDAAEKVRQVQASATEPADSVGEKE